MINDGGYSTPVVDNSNDDVTLAAILRGQFAIGGAEPM